MTFLAHHGKGREKREREKRGHDWGSFLLHCFTALLNISFTKDLVFLLSDFDASLISDRGLKTTAT